MSSPQPQPYDANLRPSRPLAGLLTIFFSPADTFDMAGKRPWIVPMIATTLLVSLLSFMTIQVMGMGTIVRNRLESNAKLAEQMGPEKINEAVQNSEHSTAQRVISYVAPAVVLPLVMVVLAGVTFGGLTITGASTTFNAALGAVAWAFYAVMVVTTIGSAIFLALTKDFSGVDPNGMLMLNAGAFMDKSTTSPVVRALAGGIDLVAFWSMFLEIIGLQRLSQRVTIGQAAGVVITLYVLVLLCKVGWAAMFG
jgi:hypothetical protein